ncbi:MAG: Hsp70 family protein, partial [Chloroflexota bacterium]
IRSAAEEQFGVPVRSATVGRPVRFAGADDDDGDRFALRRLERALHLAGFEEVAFQLEPLAAAAYFEASLSGPALLLIGDFGGGTSDFSLVQTGGRSGGSQLLGNAGVGVAGDSFDARIVHHLVAPALGSDSLIRSGSKLLPVPAWVFRSLEHWHHLSLLRGNDTLRLIRGLRAQSCQPEKLDALLELILEEEGYRLHQAVQALKTELSAQDTGGFAFSCGGLDLGATVKRSDFERWIAADLAALGACIDGLLRQAGVSARAVDQVYLTGGSSLVPAVRALFTERFAAAQLSAGQEFTAVTRGLALPPRTCSGK